MTHEAKHTPGPWTTSREDLDSFTTTKDGDTQHVVYVYRGEQPRIPVFAGKLDNARQDARLAAAAPDLLNACKSEDACSHVGPGLTGPDVLRRAAICMRAEGQHSTGRTLDKMANAMAAAIIKAEGAE